ncbi:MAG: hypothetical protein RL538_584 [Candidatus Parcubacteria bacterium]|jgi:hypothetical protein
MSSTLQINGKELQNIRVAAERTGYSRDYITRLAREERVVASQVNRQWFVDLDSLVSYAATVASEQKVRQVKLSEERKQERLEKERTQKKGRGKLRPVKLHSLKTQVLATSVLMIGLGVGVGLSQLPVLSSTETQVASAPLVSQGVVAGDVPPAAVSGETISGVPFSHESVGVATLEGVDQGILLLPQDEAGVADPSLLFSDEVKVMTDDDGAKYIARVDEHGKVVEMIPFVVVPVTPSNTP